MSPSSPSLLVGFAGSRSLPASFSGLVSACVASVAAAGGVVAVGCAAGADCVALSSALAAGCLGRVFAAFGPGGAGSCSVSAVPGVLAASAAGVPVSFWAGGGPAVPLSRRLAARSSALVAALAAAPRSGLVVFLGPGASRGSLRACRLAVLAGVPLVVFPCALLGAPVALPVLPVPGSWVVAGSGPWARGFRFVPR